MAHEDIRRLYDIFGNKDVVIVIEGLIAGLLSGIIGSMGLGGGTVLLIYLAAFMGVDQLKAQGINLIFFIPIGILSVIIYCFKKQIKWKTVAFFAISGLAGAALGTFFAGFIGDKWTRIAFGVLLIVLGIKSVFTKKSDP